VHTPSWLIAAKGFFSEPEKPTFDDPNLHLRLRQVGRSFRRRLVDRVEDLFDEACLAGDLETAALLLRAREQAQTHGQLVAGTERRTDGSDHVRLKRMLDERRGSRQAA
jgi:hypothetical protein